MAETDNGQVQDPEEPVMTLDNAGKGMAFLGMVLFTTYVLLFFLSIATPQLFNLFSGPGHLIAVSTVCTLLIVGGFGLTKLQKNVEENET